MGSFSFLFFIVVGVGVVGVCVGVCVPSFSLFY